MIGIGPFGSGVYDRLSGGAGNDLLFGDAERMEGDFVSGGDDRLYGGRGNDTLGGDGHGTTENGAGGYDSLSGGGGGDRKGGVWGKGVSVRVDPGGRRICQRTQITEHNRSKYR